jgi:MOSC domain-containing protein YiiM
MHLVSVNVRLPPAGGGTAIDKQPVAGPVAVTVDGLDGDGVGNTKHHGGPDQAVYAYGSADYTWWAHELGRSLPPGTFGENLTIDGLESGRLDIGDRLVVGKAVFEVTSPRIPCATLAGRMGDADFIRRFRDARRPGLYLRVLMGGHVAAGDRVTLERAPAASLPLLELQDLFYDRDAVRSRVERALNAPIDIRSRHVLERRLSTV